MNLTMKSVSALLLVGSLSACGGGSGTTDPIITTDPITGETIEFDGNYSGTIEGVKINCVNFNCTASAFGETVSATITESNGNIGISGNWNGSDFSAVIHEDGSYEYTFGTGTDQDLYNEAYIDGRYNQGLTSYQASNLAAVEITHLQGITGEGIKIVTHDWFTGEHNAHGAHVENVIESIATGASNVNLDKGSTLDPDQIEYVLKNADIINQSFGATQTAETFAAWGINDVSNLNKLNEIRKSQIEQNHNYGGLYVIAAGNESLDCSDLTKCNSHISFQYGSGEAIIAVGALNDEGTALDSYSNKAGLYKDVFISAPVWESSNGGRGTSYAAPIVSGAAALIMDKFNNTDPYITRDIIFSTADDLGVKGVDAVYGHGRLNIGRALSPVGMLK